MNSDNLFTNMNKIQSSVILYSCSLFVYVWVVHVSFPLQEAEHSSGALK